jgi:hypothetical protein
MDRIYAEPRDVQVTPTVRAGGDSDVYVTKSRRDTSHLFHLVMTILTGGLWIFVWIAAAGWHKAGPRRKAVTKVRREPRPA